MHWVKISCILCVFGCFKDFRPSESFVTNYLLGPWKNFTETEVNQEIYPVATYSYAITLVIVFLITDFVRYKPIIILCGVCGALTFLLIIVGKTILVMQIVEFFYGLFLSAEVAYYTYIYAKVDKKHYQEVTGHTKAASLFGRCMAGVVAQLTVSFDLLDYHQLNYVTLSAFVFGTIWAFLLPSVGQSIYFHRKTTSFEENSCTSPNGTLSQNEAEQSAYKCEEEHQRSPLQSKLSMSYKIRRAYFLLWKDFLQAFTNWHVIKWSVWWAFSTCGFLQVSSYIQLLWDTAVSKDEKIYNGAVDFMYAIIGSVTVFCVGKLPLNWSLVGDAALSVFALLEGGLLVIASYSYNIWFLYGAYIAFGVIYHTMVTVASFEVAKCISEDSYGLIFGVNIFFALILQSVLTAIVLNKSLNLSTRTQYFVYGIYFITLAVLYIVMAVITLVKYCRSGRTEKVWLGGKNEENETTAKVEDSI